MKEARSTGARKHSARLRCERDRHAPQLPSGPPHPPPMLLSQFDLRAHASQCRKHYWPWSYLTSVARRSSQYHVPIPCSRLVGLAQATLSQAT